MTKSERRYRLIANLTERGFSFDEANTLRKIELTLSRWSELTCGNGNDYASWAIERDEETEIPYMVTYPHIGETRRHKIADREKGALKRLNKIMANHPDFVSYYQGDPRGCSLYIIRKSDLNGQDINSVYTRGIAVCD
jgi:hypothetical protein